MLPGAPPWSQQVGSDPETEALIITGPGPVARHPRGGRRADPNGARDFAYKHTYDDATKLLENFGIDIPTIAAINGPSVAHTEFALLCDVTLAAETATIIDPYLLAGAAPGDGQQLTLQELIGAKRAAYHLCTGRPIGARQALEPGSVNEVLAADRLLPRAEELAETVMKAPRCPPPHPRHRPAPVEAAPCPGSRLRHRPPDVRHASRPAPRLRLACCRPPDGRQTALVLTNIRGDRDRRVAPQMANIWLRFRGPGPVAVGPAPGSSPWTGSSSRRTTVDFPALLMTGEPGGQIVVATDNLSSRTSEFTREGSLTIAGATFRNRGGTCSAGKDLPVRNRPGAATSVG